MSKTKFDKRFFESTRGRIVSMLHDSHKTVNELAEALGLSDNAVRAHLLTLERDGLVAQAGVVKGFRKPHFAYELGPEAQKLFPRSYDVLFNRFVDAIKSAMSSETLKSVMATVGVKLGKQNAVEGSLDEKLANAVDVLRELGGAAKIVREDGLTEIKSGSCPFAEAVAEHPEVCQVAESMIGEMVGVKVVERCDRTASPKCCFEIG